MNTEEFLEHYGVKGMKWGVRKSRAQRRADRAERAANRTPKQQKRRDVAKAAGSLALAAGGTILARKIAQENAHRKMRAIQSAKAAQHAKHAKRAASLAGSASTKQFAQDMAQTEAMMSQLRNGAKAQKNESMALKDALDMYDRVVGKRPGPKAARKVAGPSAKDLSANWDRMMGEANLELLKRAAGGGASS